MGNDRGNVAALVAVLFAFFLVVNVVSYIWFPFLPWFEQREAGQEIVEDQMSAEVALQNYREFRTLYFDIEAQRAQVQNAYDAEAQFHETYGDDPSEWSRSAETRHGRLHDRVTGNQNVLEQLVAEYNAMSADATAAMYKCNLPYQVDDRFAITGPPGSGPADEPQDEYRNGGDPNEEPPEASECDGLTARAEA